ncbi:hypothetical protein [Xanthomonas phaseoli]|uniref:DUF1444 domain-containing protein n=2 Tax=Xanthomonas TaxID=338 RepID=A0A8I2BVE4_XANMN|nr:hypothetical protein [Xanthomonas phaseoli]KUF36632.1 hypothetical protein AO826_19805 [Xanthomonas phaseoli pv. manihotis]MBO9722589.1 hypothetical protein [Xanthomonas phaseoli pv. manihotis]MBO9757800.1 hypothetical protein [Xanthomonas phaseoli pv. manihotis]MBO9761670.1 hypothetical protein [Xanthomonas phaseoli pv. manihotis]MBO9765783.1 hypothetical protein [Xanthomonas phaseoli pv. manihotis]
MFTQLFDKLLTRKPSQDAFAKLFEEALRAQGYQDDLVYRPDEFRLVATRGRLINLHNAYHDYTAADRQRRAEVLHGYVAGFLEDGSEESRTQTLEQVRPMLMPIVRHRAMLEEMRLEHVRKHGWQTPYTAVVRELSADCVELLAIDRSDSTSSLLGGPKDTWGISFEQALAIAHENLRDATPDRFVEVAPGIYRGAWQDSYDSSRVLLPDVLQRVPVKGRPVFMLPTRDCLLVVGDRDETAMAGMLELSLEAADNGRCISAVAFTYDDARQMVPFALPQPEHRRRQADLQRMMDMPAYALQKQLLEKIHEANQADIFVASYRVYEANDGSGRQFSVATWTRDVEASLPKADRIAFVTPKDEGDADVVVADWDKVIAVVAGLIQQEPDFHPPRFRVRGFPNEAQLRQLA